MYLAQQKTGWFINPWQCDSFYQVSIYWLHIVCIDTSLRYILHWDEFYVTNNVTTEMWKSVSWHMWLTPSPLADTRLTLSANPVHAVNKYIRTFSYLIGALNVTTTQSSEIKRLRQKSHLEILNFFWIPRNSGTEFRKTSYLLWKSLF